MWYAFKITPGWIAIAGLLYLYVFSQPDFIDNRYILVAVIFVGILFSFLCSITEMAIASLGEPELSQLAKESEENLAKKAEMTELAYIKTQQKFYETMQIYYEAEKLNAPIVICNNVANVVVTAFLPLALKTSAQPAAIQIVGFSFVPPLAGSEALTFFLTLIFIVTLGEIVPKRLGMAYALGIVKNCGGFIRLINFLFGWLGLSFVSVVEIPTRIWRKIFA